MLLKFLLLFLSVSTFIFLYIQNRNLLSPAKVIFIFSFLFYFGFYFLEPNILTTSAVFLIFLLLLILGFIDKDVTVNTESLRIKVPLTKYFILLVLTFIPFSLKIIDINSVGGVENYLFNLAFRVRELSGQGWKVIIFSSIQAIFAYLMFLFFIDNNKTFIKKLLVLFIFCVLIFMAITSGSRTSLALPIATTLILYHFIVVKVKIFTIFLIAVLISIFVIIYGSFRNTFGTTDNVGFLLKDLEFAQFYYGVNPLMIIYESGESPYLLGQTYLTFFTNFIPRIFYPDKPDTGGLVFTKFYMDDQWGGLSNLAPGVFGEAIMNFGFSFGIVFAGFLLAIVFLISVWFFRRSLFYFSSNLSIYRKGLYFMISIFFVFAAARFSYSEFTNVFFSFVLFNLLPLLFIYFLMSIKLRGR